jgi:hypothetical protein
VWSTGHAHATPVYRYRVGLLLDIHQKRGVVHAERAGDVAFEVLVQRQPTSRLDDLAQPVGIAAVDKRRAGIGQERALEKALLRNRRGMKRSGNRHPTPQVRVPERVAQPGGVGDQLLHGGTAAGRPQLGVVAIEALKHRHVGELRAVGVDGRGQLEIAASTCCSAATVLTILVIDMIRKTESGVTGSSLPTARGPAAPSYIGIYRAVAVGCDGDDVGYLARGYRVVQHLVDW